MSGAPLTGGIIAGYHPHHLDESERAVHPAVAAVLEARKRKPDPRDVIAHHEAAHVIAALVLGEPIHAVEIFADGSGGEFRRVEQTIPSSKVIEILHALGGLDDDIPLLRRKLIGLDAGPIAEHRYTGGDIVWNHRDNCNARALLDQTSLSYEQRRALADEAFERGGDCLRALGYHSRAGDGAGREGHPA